MKIIILIALVLFSKNVFSSEIVLKCENKYSYKVIKDDNNYNTSYYKYKNEDWVEVKEFKIEDNKIELFIPNMQYLACADKNLPICNYSKLISGYLEKRSTVSEVVLNDCYIGTMGCNEYKKGLKLNQSFCFAE